MSQFAQSTKVPVDRTQSEMRRTLEKYGANGFLFGQGNGNAMVMFEMQGLRIKFILPLPKGDSEKEKQVERQRWRCLLLAIKAKLECAATGITTFEQEFLAHIVLPNGQTVSENIMPQLKESYSNGKMPALLGAGQG